MLVASIMLIAATILGAAMVVRVPSEWTVLGYPGLAILFFLFAVCAGVAMAAWIFLTDRKVARTDASHKAKFIRIVFALLDNPSAAVSYEAASTLTALSSTPERRSASFAVSLVVKNQFVTASVARRLISSGTR
jgi:hypothetical protein